MKQHKVTLLTAAIGPMTAAERAKGRYMRAPDHYANMSLDDTIEDVKSHLEQKYGEPLAEAKARLDELEQKSVRKPGGEYVLDSIGRQFVDAENVKGFLSDVSAGRRVGLEVKATITSATTAADGSAGDLLVPTRDATYVGPKRRLTVRSLLPTIQVNGNSVEYAKQTGFTNSAATVAEGDLKPQSELQYDIVQVPIRTIAHWVIASRQILDDVAQLQGLIDTELRYGLQYAEELQLLNGGGTGTDLNGIASQAAAFAAGSLVIASATKLDVIGAAIYQNALAEEPVTGIIVHPSDWTDMRLLKNTDGEYIMGPPGSDVEPRLFGIPTVVTQAMAAGSFLVGNFRAATLYDRLASRVEISTEDFGQLETQSRHDLE